MLDADTIQYEVTIEDPKVFTRPWKISMPLHRHKDMDRILEYQCQAEAEEANGLFERDPRLWYPEPGKPAVPGGETEMNTRDFYARSVRVLVRTTLAAAMCVPLLHS